MFLVFQPCCFQINQAHSLQCLWICCFLCLEHTSHRYTPCYLTSFRLSSNDLLSKRAVFTALCWRGILLPSLFPLFLFNLSLPDPYLNVGSLSGGTLFCSVEEHYFVHYVKNYSDICWNLQRLYSRLLFSFHGGLKVSSCSSTWFNPYRGRWQCPGQLPVCSWQYQGLRERGGEVGILGWIGLAELFAEIGPIRPKTRSSAEEDP